MPRPHYLTCAGDDWWEARMRAFVRDDFTCQYQRLGLQPIEGGCCEDEPETRLRFLQVHHIKHRINGGNHDLDNLATVCRAHHMHIHPHMRYELGEIRRKLDYPERRKLSYGDSE